jgi:hypothetical protein
MGFIAKIGSPGVSPHQSWFKLTHYLNRAGMRRWNGQQRGQAITKQVMKPLETCYYVCSSLASCWLPAAKGWMHVWNH